MSTRSRPQAAAARLWRPDVAAHAGPTYQAIVHALEADVAAGRVAPGARLPSQRALARTLGVNLTTVTRAMREATRRGLVAGVGGSGMFVAPRAERLRDWARRDTPHPGFVDLSLGMPPHTAEVSIAAALAEFAADLARRPGECRALLAYRTPEGTVADRRASLDWLGPLGVAATPERVLVTSGAQHGTALALAAVARPGDAVLCEALTYPGLRAAAKIAGVRLVAVAHDAHGLVPRALAATMERHRATALVVTPTLQNPTGSTLPAERRREIARLARRAGLWIVEDDVYGALAAAPPPLQAHAPERTLYVTSLSKSVAGGLRLGYVVAPDDPTFESLVAAMRASTWMTAPLLAAIASAWLRDGTARRAVDQTRREIARRWKVARRALAPVWTPAADAPPSPHLWIPRPDARAEQAGVARLAKAGVGVTAGEAFRAGGEAFGLRVCLGPAASVEELEGALGTVATTLGAVSSNRRAVL